MTDKKLQNPAMSRCTVAARRDANVTANFTSEVFNAPSYVTAGEGGAYGDT